LCLRLSGKSAKAVPKKQASISIFVLIKVGVSYRKGGLMFK
jgi:hypothetical protein